MPLARPPGNPAVYISSYSWSKRESVSRMGHPLLHSQSWKSWKPAGRTDDRLLTGSTANWEGYRKGVWTRSMPTHRESHSFAKGKDTVKTSPGGVKSSPRLLWTPPPPRALEVSSILASPVLSTYSRLSTSPSQDLRHGYLNIQLTSEKNSGLEKFSKLSMVSWPPDSKW